MGIRPLLIIQTPFIYRPLLASGSMTSSRMTPEEARRMSAAEQHDWFRRATSRRSLLRGGAIGAGAAIAGPAILTGTADASTKRAADATRHRCCSRGQMARTAA